MPHTSARILIIVGRASVLFSGLPEFYVAIAACLRVAPQRNATAAVLCADMGDVLHAAQYALDHYLTVDLSAPYLQRSSLGTPYQKWAHFTNADFANVDACFRALLRTTYRVWHGANETRRIHTRGAIKSAWSWFEVAHRQFRSCAISRESPQLVVCNLVPELSSRALQELDEELRDEVPSIPNAVTFHSLPLDERHVLDDLRAEGARQVRALNGTLTDLRAWVSTHFTSADLVTGPPGNATDFWLGPLDPK